MALSLIEEIAVLEEQLKLITGKGSKAKKSAIQAEIDELKASNDSTPEEQENEQLEESQPEQPEEELGGRLRPPRGPKPTEWVKVTMEQVKQAEKDFKLCGFDPDKMIALIRP